LYFHCYLWLLLKLGSQFKVAENILIDFDQSLREWVMAVVGA